MLLRYSKMVGRLIRREDVPVYKTSLAHIWPAYRRCSLLPWEVGKSLRVVTAKVDDHLRVRIIFEPYLVNGSVLAMLIRIDGLNLIFGSGGNTRYFIFMTFSAERAEVFKCRTSMR